MIGDAARTVEWKFRWFALFYAASDYPALLPVLAAHNYIHWRATTRLCFRSSPHIITYTGERLPGSASGPRRTQLHTLASDCPALLSVLAAHNYIHSLIENRTAGKLEHVLSDSPCGFAILCIRFVCNQRCGCGVKRRGHSLASRE